MNLRFMTKKIKGLFIAFFALLGVVQAQEADEALGVKDSTSNTKK